MKQKSRFRQLIICCAFLLLSTLSFAQTPPQSNNPKALKKYNEALVALEDNRSADGIALLGNALQIDSNFIDAYLSLAGALGNTPGELWLDTTASTLDRPGPVLKVWDGTQWINCMPYTYANTIVSDTEPTLGNHPDGTLWWNSGTGLMYVLYNDITTRQWTQVSSNTVQ